MGYLDGGGEGEHTLRRNRAAFDEYELIPSSLRDVSRVDTSTTIMGTEAPVPMVSSLVGAPRLFQHEGELAVARAAHHAGLPYAISTLATVSLEDIARETDSRLWFQLYVWGDRSAADNWWTGLSDPGTGPWCSASTCRSAPSGNGSCAPE